MCVLRYLSGILPFYPSYPLTPPYDFYTPYLIWPSHSSPLSHLNLNLYPPPWFQVLEFGRLAEVGRPTDLCRNSQSKLSVLIRNSRMQAEEQSTGVDT